MISSFRRVDFKVATRMFGTSQSIETQVNNEGKRSLFVFVGCHEVSRDFRAHFIKYTSSEWHTDCICSQIDPFQIHTRPQTFFECHILVFRYPENSYLVFINGISLTYVSDGWIFLKLTGVGRMARSFPVKTACEFDLSVLQKRFRRFRMRIPFHSQVKFYFYRFPKGKGNRCKCTQSPKFYSSNENFSG